MHNISKIIVLVLFVLSHSPSSVFAQPIAPNSNNETIQSTRLSPDPVDVTAGTTLEFTGLSDEDIDPVEVTAEATLEFTGLSDEDIDPIEVTAETTLEFTGLSDEDIEPVEVTAQATLEFTGLAPSESFANVLNGNQGNRDNNEQQQRRPPPPKDEEAEELKKMIEQFASEQAAITTDQQNTQKQLLDDENTKITFTLLRVIPLDESGQTLGQSATNPFDFDDLEGDITDAQTLGTTFPVMLTLANSPPTIEELDGAGHDSVAIAILRNGEPVDHQLKFTGFDSGGGAPLSTNAFTIEPDGTGRAKIGQGHDWTLITPAESTVILDGEAVKVIIQSNDTGTFYEVQIRVKAVFFNASDRATVGEVTGFNCGLEQTACP